MTPPGVQFDGDLRPFGKGEPSPEMVDESEEIVRREDIRAAAAEVNVTDRQARPDAARREIDLAPEQLNIGRHRPVTAHDLGVAAAEPAQRVAEGNVNVERGPLAGIELLQPPAIAGGIHGGAEVGGRRIAGIARDGPVVLGDEVEIHESLVIDSAETALDLDQTGGRAPQAD